MCGTSVVFVHLFRIHRCAIFFLFFLEIHIRYFFQAIFSSFPRFARLGSRALLKPTLDLASLFPIAPLIPQVVCHEHQAVHVVYLLYLSNAAFLLPKHRLQPFPLPNHQPVHQPEISRHELRLQLHWLVQRLQHVPEPQPFVPFDLPFQRLRRLAELLNLLIERLLFLMLLSLQQKYWNCFLSILFEYPQAISPSERSVLQPLLSRFQQPLVGQLLERCHLYVQRDPTLRLSISVLK